MLEIKIDSWEKLVSQFADMLDPSNIQQIYGDGELMKEATCKNLFQV